MKNPIPKAAIVAVVFMLGGCAVGTVIDTTATVVGGAIDGVIYAGESVAEVVTD